MTRAVIFDLDGVLIDSGPSHRASWRALMEELGVAAPPEFWRRTIGRPAEEAIGRLLGRAVNPAEAEALCQRKHEHYVRLAAVLPVVPGAPAFVDELIRCGVPRAVATSARRADATRLLGALGLLDRFAVLVTAEDVARGKPDPEVYLRAACGLAVPPETCLVFEDALIGVEAARRAGMRVIGVSTAYTEPELLGAGAERVVKSFESSRWPL
ncbi:MAG: HAD family hydrolase [Candidatus Rokuibacteriota bacterium]